MIAAFAELHWYSGGLQHRAVSVDGARPAWAPPADWGGLRDGEVLAPGERAVVVRRAALGEGRVAMWVAVFAYAVDAKFGARANHAGMGVWLLDALVTDGPPLLQSLANVADRLAAAAGEDGGADAVAAQLPRFLGELLPKYIAPTPPLPRAFRGLAAGEQLVDTATYRASGPAAWRDAGERVEALGLISEGEAARVLVRVDGPDTALPEARPPGPGRLVSALPAAFADGAAALTREREEAERARTQAASREAELREAGGRAEAAAAERDAERARAEDAERRLADAEQGLPPALARELSTLRGQLGDLATRIEGAARRPALAAPRTAAPLPLQTGKDRSSVHGWLVPAMLALSLALLAYLLVTVQRLPDARTMAAIVASSAEPAQVQPERFPGMVEPAPTRPAGDPAVEPGKPG